MQNPNCVRCRDDGFYFDVTRITTYDGKVPLQKVDSRRKICTCDAGKRLLHVVKL